MTDQVRAQHPTLPGLREVYHARFDHAYPMHTHEDWAVMLVDDGAVSYRLDSHTHHATPAALTLLPPGVPHDGRPAVAGTQYRKRVLYLEPEWLPSGAAEAAALSPTLEAAGIRQMTRRIHAALDSPGDLIAAEHWLLTLRYGILNHLGAATPAQRDAPLARRLRSLLDDHLTETITIAAAAEQLGAHPSHLVRVFSRTYGMAPHQYLIGRRVDLARRLLADRHTAADAANLSGFHDQSHMTRHFRRMLGITPGALTS
ncbi:AraC family transcriptional regulator [Microbacterium paulum]